jgi:hypothetical protein
MPVETTELNSKKDFRGDLFDLKQAIHFDPETGLYSYDYAELTPEVKVALERVILQRISSAKFAEVEEALKTLKSSPGPAGTPPPPPPEEKARGDITKATEAFEEQYRKEADILEPLWEKQQRGEALTPEEQATLDEQAERLAIVRRQIAGTKSKEAYNSYEDRLNEGETLNEETQKKHDEMEKAMLAFETYDDLVSKYKIPFEENVVLTKAWLVLNPLDLSEKVRETYDLEKGTEEEKKELSETEGAIDAFETIQAFKETTKMTEDEFKTFIDAINVLDNIPDDLWLEKEVLEVAVDLQAYKNAKGLIQQIEGTPEGERTDQQTKNFANAKAKVAAYEKANPKPKEKEEGKEEEEDLEDIGTLFENKEAKKGGTRGHKRGKLTHTTRKLKK